MDLQAMHTDQQIGSATTHSCWLFGYCFSILYESLHYLPFKEFLT